MRNQTSTGPAVPSANDRRLTRRLQRGGAWVVGGRTVGMAMVLATYVYLARVMPTADFASYVLVSSVVVFLSMAAMFGLNTLVCRYVSSSFGVGNPARAQAATRLVVRVSAVSIVATGCLGWLGIKLCGDVLFRSPDLSQSAGFIALWIMLLAASQLLAETFRGLHDLRMASFLGGVSGGFASNAVFLLSAIATSFFVPLDFSVVALLAVFSLLLPTAAAAIYLRRTWPCETNPSMDSHDLAPLTVRSVIREAFPVMLVQVFGFGLAQLDIWIVGACCTDLELAVYGVVRRLSLFVAIPLTQISLVVASSISELHARGDRRRLQHILRGAATTSMMVTIPPLVTLAALPAPILEIVFDPKFRSGAEPLRILLLGQLVFALTGPCGTALMMTGRQRIALWSLVASMPIFLIAPWAATNYHLEAVAVVFVLATAIQNLIRWVAVRRVMGIATHPCLAPRYTVQLLKSLVRGAEQMNDRLPKQSSPTSAQPYGIGQTTSHKSCENQATMVHRRRSDVLVCIPCFNSQDTIAEVVQPILVHSDADVLLIDDSSDEPLLDFVKQRFPCHMDRISVMRPDAKLYSGGSKNIGIRRAIDDGYRIAILMDSDIICPHTFLQRVSDYFSDNPDKVIVAPAILPFGKWCQYADTLINFSSYLPERKREISWKDCLAGYAFALNIDVFRQRACFLDPRIAGDDVLFFRRVMASFGIEHFPMLNELAVLHKPPRDTLKKTLSAQHRYARAFFTHNDQRRAYWFNTLPLLHLLTPRFFLMLLRLVGRRRYRDLAYSPLCWYLDFTRAVQIVRLCLAGYRDPANCFGH